MAIESRTLNYVVVLAEELHFGRAAARLNIVQPALSAQIRSLEERLGTRLFERNRRHVSLTAAGESFLIEAQRAVAQIDRAEVVGRQAALGHYGMLRIGFVGSAPFGKRMPTIISRFRHSYPAVELSLEELSASEQIERLHSHALDIGFVRLPLPGNSARLRVLQRIEESIMVAVPDTHPLANHSSIHPRELSNETFVAAASHESAGWAATLAQISLDGGGMPPNVIQTSPHLATVISLVNAGLGVALVPDSLHSINFDHVRYIELAGKHYTSEVALLMREGDALPIIHNFIEIVEQYSEQHGDPGQVTRP